MNTPTLGNQQYVGTGVSTVRASLDFETYSEAGMYYDFVKGSWRRLVQGKEGIGAAGAWCYSKHITTELRCMAYDLKDGLGERKWVPGTRGMPAPQDLFDFIADGGLIQAFNSFFEYCIWLNVCEARLGWPPLPLEQLRDAQAKAQAYSFPKKLEHAAEASKAFIKKNKDGKALIKKFCAPRTPTKDDKRMRILFHQDPEAAGRFLDYNVDDIRAEASVAEKCPDLSPTELALWLLDQKINLRGCRIDTDSLQDFIPILKDIETKYTVELNHITRGQVGTVKQVGAMAAFVTDNGYPMSSIAKEHVLAALDSEQLPPVCRRVLEIRQMLALSSVAKIPTIFHCLDFNDLRVRNMFCYHQAHTGRFAGQGIQPQNFPKSGPQVWSCQSCGFYYGRSDVWCCNQAPVKKEWCIEAVECVLQLCKSRNLAALEQFYPNGFLAISGCLRALFVAAPSKELISSDYSAIEAVVLAALAGEEWRMEVFRTHGKIYETSASKITGIPLAEFTAYKKSSGDHHPMRNKIGKVAELASGFGGGIKSWKAFGADKFMDDDEIKLNVRRWREESPMIKKFWYGLEDAAVSAIRSPGHWFEFRGIYYLVKDSTLFCRLPSGRNITYHEPVLVPGVTDWGKKTIRITYMGWSSKHSKWLRLDTWGGKLTENVVQAVGRDIFTHAMPLIEAAGYPIVLHTHDELTSEIPVGFGSIEEYEHIMQQTPEWCRSWPIKASGGWRGHRYRKD